MDNQTHNAAGILGAVIEKFVSPDDNTTLSFIKAMMVKQKRKNLRKMQLFGNSEQLHQTKKNILLPSLHYEAGHSNSFTIANRYSSCSSSQSVHHPGVRLHCPHKLLHFLFYQSLLFFIYKELYLYRSFAISVIWHRCFPHS